MQKQMSKMRKKTLVQVCVLGAALNPEMGLANNGACPQEPTQTFRESHEIFAQARILKLDDLRLGKTWTCMPISNESGLYALADLLVQGIIGPGKSPARALVDGDVVVEPLAVDEFRHVLDVELDSLARDHELVAAAMRVELFSSSLLAFSPAV